MKEHASLIILWHNSYNCSKNIKELTMRALHGFEFTITLLHTHTLRQYMDADYVVVFWAHKIIP